MPLSSYAELQTAVLDWLARPGDPLVAPAVPDMILMFEEDARDRLQTRFTEKTVMLTPPPDSNVIPLPLDYGELRSLWMDGSMGRRHFTYQTPRNMDGNISFNTQVPAAYTIEGLNLRLTGDLGGASSTTMVPASEFTLTLTPGATSTTIHDSLIGPTTLIDLMPLTSNAAAAAPSIWVTPGTGEAVIHHANSPNADQIFSCTIDGVVMTIDGEPVTSGVIGLNYLSGLPPLGPAVPTNWLLTQYPSAYLWGTLSCAAPYIGDDPRLQLWLAAREAAIERIRLADRRAKFPHGLMIQTDVRNP